MFGIFETGIEHISPGQIVMICIGLGLISLAIIKKWEPLLLLPIGFGVILANFPLGGLMDEGGLLRLLYNAGIKTVIIPPLIFLGLGAMTDFGPVISNPKTILLGAAAQIGIYGAFFMAIIFGFDINEACSIGIIGGADGPTTIYTTELLAHHLLGATAVAAYSYMALVPIIQPPIIKFLTTEKERKIRMRQLRPVSRNEKIVFPLVTCILIILLVPSSAPLIGMFMLGNLMRECGVVDRLSKAAQNELMNILTIFLGVTVGATMSAENFIRVESLLVFFLGLAAFSISTAGGVIFGKIMNLFIKEKINPMIGAAGVSAVPMSARVVQMMGLKEDPENHLLMHAMGPNVAGVIGSAVAAGVFIGIVG